MRIARLFVRGFVFAVLSAASLFSQPKLHLVGGTTVDFGDVYSASAQKFLTLRNAGRDTLVISNVSASCGCTGALVSHDHIAPGDSGILAITFDAKRFDGAVEKTVSFASNDKSQEHVSVKFHANVHKTLECDPEYFYFSTHPDSLSTKELSLKNSSKQKIRLLRINVPTDLISVQASRMEIEPGDEIMLQASGSFKAPGTFRGNIEISTDYPIVPTFTLRYFAFVKENR